MRLSGPNHSLSLKAAVRRTIAHTLHLMNKTHRITLCPSTNVSVDLLCARPLGAGEIKGKYGT